jgi:hypothetical protein
MTVTAVLDMDSQESRNPDDVKLLLILDVRGWFSNPVSSQSLYYLFCIYSNNLMSWLPSNCITK